MNWLGCQKNIYGIRGLYNVGDFTMVEDLKTQNISIEMSLDYQRFKLKIIFAITLLVIAGSLILVTSLLSGGSIFIGLLIILIFGIFYAYETKKEFKRLSADPLLEHSEIIEMVRILSENGNIQPPSVLVQDEDIINAGALSTPGKSYIILPQGIIDSFDNGDIPKEEMESILAHELGHIINKDSFISTGLWATIRLFQIIRNGLERIRPFIAKITQKSAEATRRSDSDGVAGWMLFGMTLFLVLLSVLVIVSSISLFILMFICIFFIHLLGRQQEHVADIISARLTQKPEVMASALHNIYKLDLVGASTSELSPYESAIVNKSTMELKDEKLTFRNRLDEYNSTHPHLTYRIDLLASPRFYPNWLLSLKDKVNAFDLSKYPLNNLSSIKIKNFEIPLSNSFYHGILLGILVGVVYLTLNYLVPFTQLIYVLLVISSVWIGLFSLSKDYPTESSLNLNYFNEILTIIFVFTLTYSFLTNIATGVIAFYSTIILGMAIMVPVSFISGVALTHVKKDKVDR